MMYDCYFKNYDKPIVNNIINTCTLQVLNVENEKNENRDEKSSVFNLIRSEKSVQKI